MRKLSLATFAYSFAVLVMHYFHPAYAGHIAALLSIVIAPVACVVLRGKLRIGALISAVFVLLGVVRYEVHYNQTVAQFEDYIGEECRVTAEVCDFPVIYEDSVKYTVKLDTDLLPEIKAVVYDYTTSETELRPGDRFRATIVLSSALLSSGEPTNDYISKGIYVRGYVTDEVKVISTDNKLSYMPIYLAESLRNTISEYMPQRSAAFLSALMTGDKTELYDDVSLYNILSKAGLSHVVAVSGMHVSFVITLVIMLVGHGKGSLISLIFIALFAVMTGMSPSVLRAVFMQSLFLLAPILRREADGITSISFALLILLIINPFSISSISLQLSFLAMMGIITITPRAVKWFELKCPFTNDWLISAYRFVSLSLCGSLGATIFTAPLSAYYFGSITVLAPLTNLLVLWITPVCFVGGFLLCAMNAILPVFAPVAAFLLDVCVSFVFVIAEWVSSFDFSSIYLPPSMLVIWFVFVYTIIGIMFLFRKEGVYRPLIPIVSAILGLVVLTVWVQRNHDGMTVSAIDVGQGQCIAVINNDRTLMIDCGGNYDAGETAARWLYSHGRKEIDSLILSHFDKDHVNGAADLMLRIPVREIVYCGNNITDDELPLLEEIRKIAESTNTNLRLVNTEADFDLGPLFVKLKAIDGDHSNDGLITYMRSEGYDLLVMGDADFDGEGQLLRWPWIHEIECLVVGHHGSKYSTGESLLERVQPEVAIISCGYNTYGHPSEEVLDRLEAQNVVIYRTDKMGTIEIKVR